MAPRRRRRRRWWPPACWTSTVRFQFSPRTPSLFYMEITIVHRKVCSRMVKGMAVDGGAGSPAPPTRKRTQDGGCPSPSLDSASSPMFSRFRPQQPGFAWACTRSRVSLFRGGPSGFWTANRHQTHKTACEQVRRNAMEGKAAPHAGTRPHSPPPSPAHSQYSHAPEAMSSANTHTPRSILLARVLPVRAVTQDTAL